MGWIADLLKEIPSAARYKSELEAMEKKVIMLEAENVNLRQEIQRRDDVVQKEKSHDGRLEEVREKILLAVANNPDASDQQLARITGVGELIAKFHLAELKASKMVSIQIIAGSDWAGTSGSTTWSIKQPGLSYLVAHGLIA